MFSAFYQYQTGRHWTPYATLRGLWYNDRETIFMTPRGSEQLPDRGVLDLHLEYNLPLGNDLELALFIDTFNTLNSDKITDVSERWGTYYYEYTDHPAASEWVETSSYGTTTSIQEPRTIRVGARFSF
jgi:hypothetical protein